MNTELYKKLQLSGNDEFLKLVRYIKPYNVDDIAKKIIDDRLATLGYAFDYGCCGQNIIRRLT